MFYINKYKEKDLKDFFPIKCVSYDTDGMQLGKIFRFDTFYLKIYDDDVYNNSYRVYAYLYHENDPEFVDVVSYNNFPNYASQFKYDDYLNHIMNTERRWTSE